MKMTQQFKIMNFMENFIILVNNQFSIPASQRKSFAVQDQLSTMNKEDQHWYKS
jgi:hypothetical protein